MLEVSVHDVATPAGTISYHRFGHGPRFIVAPNSAMYGVAQVLANSEFSIYLEMLTAFATLVIFDRPGLGWSDPLTEEISNESAVETMLAVFAHAGIESATVSAMGYDAQPVLVFASEHPERTDALVCVNTTANLVAEGDDRSGMRPEDLAEWVASLTQADGGVDMFERVAPSRSSDHAESRWFHQTGRNSASPSTARRYIEFTASNDVRPYLPRITAPTLVIHTRDNPFIPLDAARVIAGTVPGARLHVLEGGDHLLAADQLIEVATEIERLVTGRAGRRRRASARHGLAAATPAEVRVAQLVCEGLSNPQIAARLGVSPHTVKTQVASLLLKTGTASRAELAFYVASRASS